MDNANSMDYLEKIRNQVIENLKRTAFAPSVQMTDVPREPLVEGMDDEADAILDDLDEDENKDKRYTKRRFDQYIEKEGELSDSEDEELNEANGIRRQPGIQLRKNAVNYRNIDAADSGVDSAIPTPREGSSVPDDALAGQDEKMEDADQPEEREVPEELEELKGPEEQGQLSPTPAQPSQPVVDEDTKMEDDVPTTEPAVAPNAAEVSPDREQSAAPAPVSEKPSPPANVEENDVTMGEAAPEPANEETRAVLVGPQATTPPESPAPAAAQAPVVPTATPTANPEVVEPPQPVAASDAAGETAPKETTPVKAEGDPEKAEPEGTPKPEL